MNFRIGRNNTHLDHIAAPCVFVAAAALWMLIMGNGHAWNNQIGQWPAGLAPWFGSLRLDFIALFAVMAAMSFTLLRRTNGRGMSAMLAAMLIGGQIAAAVSTRDLVFGTFPHGIDHPAFMFRVREFGEIFPTALGSYNPWWNAGTEHFIGVTSGAHNFAILNMPLLKTLDIADFYGPALFFWLMVGFPWIAVASLRAAGVRWSGAFAGGIMMCAATRAMFLFFWQSGNVGSMVSSMLALPVAALGWRIVVLRRCSAWTALALGLAAWLVCIWSPGVFVCVGVAAGWLLVFRHWTRRQVICLFSGGAIALVLLSPWLWTTFYPCRGILEYVGEGGTHISRMQMAQAALRQFSMRIQEFHPAIIFLGMIPAALALRGVARRYMLAIILTLAGVTLSVAFKHQSQLDRVALHIAMVCILPASIISGRLMSAHGHASPARPAFAKAAAQGALLALLVMGIRVACAHMGNNAGFQMWPSQQSVDEFITVVQREVPEDARLAFAGMTDCRYEWGKPSFFPILANREMMADDYYGYPKGLISYNYPPVPYRKSIEGVVAFSQAYGISHWTTADDYWRGVFARTPEHFRLVHSMQMQSSTVDIYKCLDVANPTRFIEGAGRVDARENRIDVYPANSDMGKLVIRYNWRDGLKCLTPDAVIKPYAVDSNIVFIAIEPNGSEKVSIGYSPSWKPIKPNFDGTFHH